MAIGLRMVLRKWRLTMAVQSRKLSKPVNLHRNAVESKNMINRKLGSLLGKRQFI